MISLSTGMRVLIPYGMIPYKNRSFRGPVQIEYNVKIETWNDGAGYRRIETECWGETSVTNVVVTEAGSYSGLIDSCITQA